MHGGGGIYLDMQPQKNGGVLIFNPINATELQQYLNTVYLRKRNTIQMVAFGVFILAQLSHYLIRVQYVQTNAIKWWRFNILSYVKLSQYIITVQYVQTKAKKWWRFYISSQTQLNHNVKKCTRAIHMYRQMR